MIYARPEDKEERTRLDHFANTLKDHIYKAGIKKITTYYDCPAGKNPIVHVKKFEHADVVLVLDSATLKRKFEQQRSLLFGEAIICLNKCRGSIIPIRLRGKKSTVFPGYFKQHQALDWREGKYQQHLRELLRSMFSMGQHDQKYAALWPLQQQQNTLNEKGNHGLGNDEIPGNLTERKLTRS